MEQDLLSRNEELANILELIGNYYIMDKDTYRAKSFNTASIKIREHPVAIINGEQARREITGIGESIQVVIDEYINTGTVTRLKELEAKFPDRKPVMDYFMSFYGIGPATALKFYNQGLRTLEDIWVHGNLNDAQKTGILWRDHINKRIERSEMDLINEKIKSILDKYGIRWTIAGSYRREEPSSGDVDILVESRPDLDMNGLISLLSPILPASLASGVSKHNGMLQIGPEYYGHRVDIRIVPTESYAAALMYFTGSQRFNILMRQRAIEKGMTLNEYGLFYIDSDIHIPINSETDIFNMLGVKYLHPRERTRNIPVLPVY